LREFFVLWRGFCRGFGVDFIGLGQARPLREFSGEKKSTPRSCASPKRNEQKNWQARPSPKIHAKIHGKIHATRTKIHATILGTLSGPRPKRNPRQNPRHKTQNPRHYLAHPPPSPWDEKSTRNPRHEIEEIHPAVLALLRNSDPFGEPVS
jgi:hypothetical protein